MGPRNPYSVTPRVDSGIETEVRGEAYGVSGVEGPGVGSDDDRNDSGGGRTQGTRIFARLSVYVGEF